MSLNQSFKQIEIILIDDKSRDNKTKIIEKEIKIDGRIKLIKNTENKGILYSRRKGVLNAKSDYIIFMDQDDFLINNILKKIYNYNLNKKIDVVEFLNIIEKKER